MLPHCFRLRLPPAEIRSVLEYIDGLNRFGRRRGWLGPGSHLSVPPAVYLVPGIHQDNNLVM